MSARSKQHNDMAKAKLKIKIATQLKKAAGKGLEAALRFLKARVKETLNVPAPRVALRGRALPGQKKGSIIGYRATTRALPKAPPRKVTGRMQQSVDQKMLTPTVGLIGLNARADPTKGYPQGFNYPRHLELGSMDRWGEGEHQFIKPTVEKYRRELEIIVGAEIKTELRVS